VITGELPGYKLCYWERESPAFNIGGVIGQRRLAELAGQARCPPGQVVVRDAHRGRGVVPIPLRGPLLEALWIAGPLPIGPRAIGASAEGGVRQHQENSTVRVIQAVKLDGSTGALGGGGSRTP
jgi:hypothetical protein